ncbi:TadE/TadG family type IV pilus assembly protein [Roseobacter sp. A03A-229]
MHTPLLDKLRRGLGRFGRKEDANIALEAVIIAPILFWAYMATVTIFDAYRQHSINQKAAYTIGDMVSREDRALTGAYMSGARSLFDSLARSSEPSTVRVTSVWYDAVNNRYVCDWSQSIGGLAPATASEVERWDTLLPVLPNFERITVVETWARYNAPFQVGIGDHDIHNFIFTRPRRAPAITWDGNAACI